MCCFVGFLAVCIGSIPIGIIGSGYVEEVQREHAEARERARRRPPTVTACMAAAVAEGRAGSEGGREGEGGDAWGGGGEAAQAAVLAPAQVRSLLERATSEASLAELNDDELEELHGVLCGASESLHAFMFKERRNR